MTGCFNGNINISEEHAGEFKSEDIGQVIFQSQKGSTPIFTIRFQSRVCFELSDEKNSS